VSPARALAVSCRPRQWIKSGLVFIPLISSKSLESAGAVRHTVIAAAAFSLMASAVYLLNDIADRECDRAHPGKKLRPIAAGAVAVRTAAAAAILLAGGGLGLSALLGWKVLLVVALYAASNLGYSLGLRKEPVLDVLLVSAGFVMRPIAGAYAIPVRVSAWLFVVSMLLALALALLKRRAELVGLEKLAIECRPALGSYSVTFLDQLIAIVTGAGIISYALYTFQSEHSEALVATLPFFLYGVFRYLYLVYERGAGGAPEEIFLRDRALQIDALIYLAVVVAILMSRY
jgi:4-hydroxybenzoate polyprenyltransferase